jgi:hypothetical protein
MEKSVRGAKRELGGCVVCSGNIHDMDDEYVYELARARRCGPTVLPAHGRRA